VILIFFTKYIWLQIADEGEGSVEVEKSKSIHELQSSENDVRSVFGISLSLVLFSSSSGQITKCFMFLLVTLLTMFFYLGTYFFWFW
jgi:hypothetical protein